MSLWELPWLRTTEVCRLVALAVNHNFDLDKDEVMKGPFARKLSTNQ